MAKGDFLDRLSGGEAVRKAGAHYTREVGDEQTFLQAEFFDYGALLLFGHFPFLRDSGGTGDTDSGEAHANAKQDAASKAAEKPLAGDKTAAKPAKPKAAAKSKDADKPKPSAKSEAKPADQQSATTPHT